MEKVITSFDRIGYLDGLRGLAILAVMGYHYYSRFSDSGKPIYPYGNLLAGFVPFQYGYYGVYLFFGISGFVIALTLERCRSIDEFAVRRFARLYPTMLLCSLLTWVILTIWPTFWPQSLANFLPSLTFIDGQIWNRLIPGLDSQWIDGAYWSLFVEVRFYMLAAFIYFLNRERFVQFFTAFCILAVIAHVILRAAGQNYWADLLQMAFVVKYLPWFMIGVAALLHTKGRHRATLVVIVTAICLLASLVTVGEKKSDFLAGCVVVFLLFSPFYSRSISSFLSRPWLIGIGIASYSLYLLHQNAGLTLIYVSANYLSLTGAAALPVSLVIGVIFIIASRVIFRSWESPLNKMIVKTYSGVRIKWVPRRA